MASPRIERAEQLVDEIRAALDAADLPKVLSTLDSKHVESAARHGVVLVAAPRLTFDGPFGDVQTAYELHVVAGPADNYLAAWERIDQIIDVLAGRINLATGEPGGFQPLRGETIPAYTLTLNDLD
ncbi:hypothetical protein [Microbacterium dauci]|uniref:Uncharacterized protein n=1 Tax=Microbacterium dauci TaxID=3048008 RepID=A0ABT6ZGQ2_9MICO|nr:hypothetical protein [Microbacterium sp. LX3-4]MDJ1115342.1 hypothetical protein [Microbacterium sp. LX3-4]